MNFTSTLASGRKCDVKTVSLDSEKSTLKSVWTPSNTHNIHSPGTLLDTPCEYWVGPTFSLRTASILGGINSARCWKHSWEILVHFDMIASNLLQICQLYIHVVNLLVHHIPKVLYWIEIWWLWRPLGYSELIVMFKKPVLDHLSFVTWFMILLEVAIRRWVHCGHKGMVMVSNNTQVGI